nr:hypothetical protein [uncultured Flavobacterium sp.]
MIQEKLKKILSFNGISLIIGFTGSLATFLTVLVTDLSLQISLKWLVFCVYILITVILFLIKLLIEMNTELKIKHPNTSKVVRYISERSTFLVNKNDFLGHSAMVSIFYFDDLFEVEFGKGYVKNIQENFTQIQLIEITQSFSTNYSSVIEKIDSNDINILNKLIVKCYITYTN